MDIQIRTLKADIGADLAAIADIYAALNRYDDAPAGKEQLIVVAYYLHKTWCEFLTFWERMRYEDSDIRS
jgi:hypothetical protein